MLYPSDTNWDDWGIKEELHRYFTLYWEELFDDATPDTWQVRSCNIYTLMEELEAAAEVAKSFEGYRRVMEILIAESFSILNRDPVCKKYYPFVSRYLNSWKNPKIGESQVPEVQQIARVIKGLLRDYWNKAASLVRELLAEANPKFKEELYDASMSLAVVVSSRGYSGEYVEQVFGNNITVSGSTLPFVDRFDQMVAALSSGRQEYTCTFLPILGGPKQIYSIDPSDKLTFTQGWPTPLVTGPHKEFYQRGGSKEWFINITVKALDPVSARHVAGQRISRLFAALNFFYVRESFFLKVSEALVRSPDGSHSIVALSAARKGHIPNARMGDKKAEALMSVQSRLPRKDSDQLLASLQYHRLAMTATNDETRFVNLWVALESLCYGGHGSIIDTVCDRIGPCVAIGNIRKTIANLAIYVRRLWGDGDAKPFLAIFPKSTKRHLEPIDLLTVILAPDGDDNFRELLKLTSGHRLICNRLTRVKMNLLKDAKSVAASFENHHRNVDWQLRRIYRVRNEIVHTGSSTPLLAHLTQHLHSYFYSTIRVLTNELQRQHDWAINDTFEYCSQLFSDLVKCLSQAGGPAISIATLLSPELCLVPQAAPFSWPVEVEEKIATAVTPQSS